MSATVVEVAGDVKRAAAGIAATDAAGWSAVQLNEQLAAGTQLKTALRSHVVLLFGKDTVVQVRKASLASIDDYYRTQTQKTVRLGLGYGTMRGGSTDEELRTDLVVDSTVATLAKRGTEGWQIEVDPSTGQFAISLSAAGVVEALEKLAGSSRSVLPHEYVNQSNLLEMWVQQDVFDRTITFYVDASLTPAESDFAVFNTGGVAVMSPASGTEAVDGTGRSDPTFVNDVLTDRATSLNPLLITPPPGGVLVRSEGDFGFGATLSQLLSAGALRGASPTGRYTMLRPTDNSASMRVLLKR